MLYLFLNIMARSKNPHKAVKITITGTPKLSSYLDELVCEEGYGNSPSEVARSLVWRGIEELIKNGVLDRKKGRFSS